MNKKSILVGALALGAFTVGTAKTFVSLGDGNEVRENLSSENTLSFSKHSADLKCGEGKCGSDKKDKTTEASCGADKKDKTTEASCGTKKKVKKEKK